MSWNMKCHFTHKQSHNGQITNRFKRKELTLNDMLQITGLNWDWCPELSLRSMITVYENYGNIMSDIKQPYYSTVQLPNNAAKQPGKKGFTSTL